MLYSIFIIMLVCGSCIFCLSLVLMFALHILDVMDELSGRKAKRQIKHLKELNLGTGSLEGISSGLATGDIYQAFSSGSLLSEEISLAEKMPIGKSKQEDKIGRAHV